jgi:hypothetical protein
MRRLQEGVAGRPARPVVPHFQDVGRGKHPGEGRFGHETGVPHQQRREFAQRYRQDHRIRVEVVALPRPDQWRMQHLKAHPVNGPFGPGARRMPAHVVRGQGAEPAVVGTVAERLPRLDHRANIDPVDQGARPSHVITVRVRQDEGIKPRHPLAGKQRQQDPSSGINPAALHRPRIDREPVATGGADQRGVALPDIHEK